VNNLKLLKFGELIDLLSEHTLRFTKMVKSKTTDEEFDTCKRKIKELQAEIKTREAAGREKNSRSSAGN